MMTDNEIEMALREFAVLTERGEMAWTANSERRRLESRDLVDFLVTIQIMDDGITFEIVEEGTGTVASISKSDGRTPGERARLQGLAYTLYQIARPQSGSDTAARLKDAIAQRKSGKPA